MCINSNQYKSSRLENLGPWCFRMLSDFSRICALKSICACVGLCVSLDCLDIDSEHQLFTFNINPCEIFGFLKKDMYWFVNCFSSNGIKWWNYVRSLKKNTESETSNLADWLDKMVDQSCIIDLISDFG